MNLLDADIPRAIANAQIGLFNDPGEVTHEQNKLFGQQTSKREVSNLSNADKANEQNNKITNIEQKNIQNS